MVISWLISVLVMCRLVFISGSRLVGNVLVSIVMKLVVVSVSRFVMGKCVWVGVDGFVI